MEHWDRLWPGGYTFLYDDGLFRPSTDTFLLGSFPRLRRGMAVCELGAGTGLLSLLLLAREQELTPRQREMVFLYYDRGLKMSQIAQKLGVNRSTVSRTVKRAKQRLYRCLRYAL